jgi:hypothetical protein
MQSSNMKTSTFHVGPIRRAWVIPPPGCPARLPAIRRATTPCAKFLGLQIKRLEEVVEGTVAILASLQGSAAVDGHKPLMRSRLWPPNERHGECRGPDGMSASTAHVSIATMVRGLGCDPINARERKRTACVSTRTCCHVARACASAWSRRPAYPSLLGPSSRHAPCPA